MRILLLTLIMLAAADAAEPAVPEPTLASILADLPEAVAAELRAQQTAFRAEHDRDPAFADYAPWVDTACHQLGAVYSRLYWHTDLDAALAEARNRGVPVLSLRLLGRLDEELSCANSRFFRRVLYPNQALAEVLRERFVLHWSSERPVPRVTVEYGDGRRIETTITGNSIHYVLDHDGRVVDGLPGLVTPRAFAAFCRLVASEMTMDRRSAASPRYRFTPGAEFLAWATEQTGPFGRDPSQHPEPMARISRGDLAAPDHLAADHAQLQTFSKSLPEMPLQDQVAARRATALFEPAVDAGSEAPVYDATTRRLIAADIARAADRAHRLVDIEAELARFAARVRADSVHTIGVLHPALQQLLAEAGPPGSQARALINVNTTVYRELFASDRDDHWLGLVDFGYTGLPDGGVHLPRADYWGAVCRDRPFLAPRTLTDDIALPQ